MSSSSLVDRYFNNLLEMDSIWYRWGLAQTEKVDAFFPQIFCKEIVLLLFRVHFLMLLNSAVTI